MGELLALPAHELTEWMAYYELEPWGPARGEMQRAMSMALFANVNRDAKKRPEPYGADDFLPPLHLIVEAGQRTAADPAQRLLRKVRTINAALGGVEKGR